MKHKTRKERDDFTLKIISIKNQPCKCRPEDEYICKRCQHLMRLHPNRDVSFVIAFVEEWERKLEAGDESVYADIPIKKPIKRVKLPEGWPSTSKKET